MTVTGLRPAGESVLPAAGRTRRRIALTAAGVVVFAVFAVWLVAFSPVFGVGSVEVHGTRTITAAAVEKAARVDMGQPTVRVDTDAIERRVERLPQVATATVSTSFPSTVVVDVTERVPVGYVTVAGRRLLVDRTGNRYLGVSSTPSLPKLVIPDGDTKISAGSALATVATALSPDLREHTTSVEALDPSAITLVLEARGDDTVVVQWGSAARSRDKAAVVEVLRTRKGVERIDVSDPDQPFTS